MAITIDIPAEIERELRARDPHLDTHARDEFLLAGYRAGRLSTSDIAEVLRLDSRLAAERWLAEHGACQNYSLEDLEADRRTLDRLLGPVSR